MYKLIVDTSCDIEKSKAKAMNIEYVPFKISLGKREFIDDENLKLEEYLDAMIAHPGPIKTACPSPFDYLKAIEKNLDKNIVILTISSKLSGSYNSAKVACEEALKKYPKLKISVIDSLSASAGETKIAYAAKKILDEGLDFDVAIERIRGQVNKLHTFFVLDNMQNLIKNGRIKKATGLIAQALNIRPIMMGEMGEISLYEMNRGMKKSLQKLTDALGNFYDDFSEITVFISHVRAVERANELKDQIQKKYAPKEIIVNHANGLSSGYADIGGIVIGF